MRISISLLLGPALLLLWPAYAGAATLPALPQTFLDTTYSPPSGNTIAVNAGGNLQTAINNAALGDTIVLQAGATFTGPFTLPNKTGSGWIYIRSSAYSSLPPPGSRVSPADAINMPKITVTDLGGGSIRTSTGAHHYRFAGIEFKPVAGKFVYDLIEIGSDETSAANLPHDITFDRCYIHGDPTVGGRRGVAMNGSRVAVIDSYVSGFKEVGADTQALWTYNSPGPLKIVNNYLEAAGENFLAGGADPAISNLVPSDIEIRSNYFFKPLAWIGQSWSVKNLLEFKNGQRILVEGNVFENNWAAAQAGFAILITPRNQNGTAPWSITQDITIRLNKVINVGSGIDLTGTDTDFPSQRTQRLLVENNLIIVTRLQGADGRIFNITEGTINETIRHNTALITVAGGTMAFCENNPKANQFDFRDNLVSAGNYGFLGTGTNTGLETLNAYFTNYMFFKNAIIGPPTSGTSADYPASNFFPADTTAVGFVDYAGGNYRLAASSAYKNAASDGKDIGADIDAIEAAIAGAVTPSFVLTVTKAGGGTGTVTSSPVGIDCGAACSTNFNSGTTVTLAAAAATGSTFAGWSGGGCSGAGGCTVTMDAAKSVTATFAGAVTPSFVLTVTNTGGGTGTVTSSPAGINCGAACSASFSSGTTVTLTAAAATGSTFAGWSGGGCAGAGGCTVTMDAVKSVAATFNLSTGDARIYGISTRANVLTGGDVMIGGFIIGGSTPKTVVVRARGPSLGVAGALADPMLTLVPASGPTLTNDDWQTASNAAALAASGFQPANAKESALLVTLNPGAYTAIVTGVGNTTGVAIVEVYEMDHPENPLVGISTRARVQTGGNVMIGGFTIEGTSPQTVVVRARGRSMGVAGALADPTLTLVPDSGPALTNDDWQTDPNAPALAASGFAPTNVKESALLVTLNPGAYTAIVSGVGGTTGIAIIEVYKQ